MPLLAFSAGFVLAASLGAALTWTLRPRPGRKPREGQEATPREGGPQTLALILTHNALGMAHVRDRKFVWANERWAQILGLLPGHLVGADLRAYHLDQAAYDAFGREAYATLGRGAAYAADTRLRRVDGTPFWGRLSGSLLVPGQPEAGSVWCLEDVTARVEAQEERAEALALNEKLIASSATGILLYRAADATCILANQAGARMMGLSRASLLQGCYRRLPSWEDSGLLAAAEAALASETDQRLETCLAHGGQVLWLEVQFVPFVSRGERLLLVMMVDVSERTQAGLALQESQERYRVVVNSLNEGLAIVGQDRRFTFVNERLARMLGYQAEEILGQVQTFILAQEDLEVMEERHRARTPGSRDQYEIRLQRKDGETLPALLSVAPAEDAEGRPLAAPMLVTDISERKRVEQEREALLGELKQKNKELETLVYVASHDLRSPLVNIQGFSQRLARALAVFQQSLETATSLEGLKGELLPLLQERMPAALGYIRASGVKMDAIINGLLRLSRAGRLVLRSELLDMDQLLQACAASMAFQFQSADGRLEVEALPACKADPVQIAQVFSNLLDNAVKYRDPDVPLSVRVWGRAQGKAVLYVVEDNGLGIPAEHRERVWDIFQRLDPTGPTPGEGLGLTLVRRMVERNGGRIWVESSGGSGCRFHVELPAG